MPVSGKPDTQKPPASIAILLVCAAFGLPGLGIVWTWQQWRYQKSYRHKNYSQASRIWPQRAQAWRKLALQRLNPAGDAAPDLPGALRAAQRAVRDDRADWRNWRCLAQTAIESGKMRLAQTAMRKMRKRSDGFYARYLYANLQLMNGNPQAYWQNLIPALAIMPARKLPLIFPLILPAADEHYSKISWATRKAIHLTKMHTRYVSNPGQAFYLGHAYLEFLIQPRQLARAARWWPRMIRYAGPPDHWTRQRMSAMHESGLELLQNAMANGDSSLAMQIWHTGIKMHAWGRLRTAIGLEDAQRIPDGDFMLRLNRQPLAWQACFTCGPYVTRTRFAHAFQSRKNHSPDRPQYSFNLDFSGNENNVPQIASQWLALRPGQKYQLNFKIRTTDIPSRMLKTGTLIYIKATSDQKNQYIARIDVQKSSQWRNMWAQFATPNAATPLVSHPVHFHPTDFTPGTAYQLIIAYQRPLGQMPLRGRISLTGFQIKPIQAVKP